MEIRKVKERKDGIKYVIIPKVSEIKKDDLVLVTNNLTMVTKFKEEEENDRQRKD